jgi:hypothetical protein
MAQPVKDIPVLTGKDAKRFEREVRENQHRKIPQKEYERAQAVFKNVVMRG